jgi:hypothetical protein
VIEPLKNIKDPIAQELIKKVPEFNFDLDLLNFELPE